MISAVTSGLSTIIGWVSTVVDALVGTSGDLADLLPMFALGIAISVILVAMKIIRKIIWAA